MRSKLFIPLLAFMLCVGAIFFAIPANASDGTDAEFLSVDAVWLEGDMLHIEVTDKLTGINQTLEVSLTDYAGNSEYVSVQAVDRNGNKSNTIQFKNPYYIPETDTLDPSNPAESQSAVPNGEKPLTPDGTGTVVDNVTDGDGKEFFTITTEDGNVFYMIIDRQRTTDNVYLLNAVTEDDLAALAAKNNKKSTSALPTEESTTQTVIPSTTETPAQNPKPSPNNGGISNGTVIFIIVAAAAVGIAGYYFKILRPRKQAGDAEDEGEDDFEDNDYGDGDGDYGEDGDTE